MSCTCNCSCIYLVPIFQHLDAKEVAKISEITTQRNFKKGEYLYRQGESVGQLFVLHTGKIKLFRHSIDGKEQVIRTLYPKEFLGELSLISHSKQTNSATALEDSEVCMIRWDKLKTLMESNVSIAFKVMEELGKRLEQTESRLEMSNLYTVEMRLANYLLEASKGDDRFELELSKGDVASLLGTTQETLSRRLSTFQQEKLIKLEGQRTITILDREALGDYTQQL
ncbi:MAG: Crp/Fnr family transcriptional regulator [Sphaerochaetaceae bacterium]|jgi:CRP-like cAMP-binding protein